MIGFLVVIEVQCHCELTGIFMKLNEDPRALEALNSLISFAPGRIILVLGKSGCDPCKKLIQSIILNLDEGGLKSVRVSIYAQGNTEVRSAHLRLGCKSYPYTLLIDNGVIEGVIEGCRETHGQPSIEAHVDFLQKM